METNTNEDFNLYILVHFIIGSLFKNSQKNKEDKTRTWYEILYIYIYIECLHYCINYWLLLL